MTELATARQMEIEYITPMGRDEARVKTDQIKHNLRNTRLLLLEMYEREGWRALGYSSWREYGQDEFGYSEPRIYQLMQAAKVEREISTIVEISDDSVRAIPEGQLRPLTRLEPEQQREAWTLAHEKANGTNGKVTAAIVKQAADEVVGRPHIANNSGNNEWYTPPEYIAAARRVMGEIDLDPASSDKANEIVGARCYHTLETNGLYREWAGRVWMNPPYSQPEIVKFTERLVAELIDGKVTEAIVLVNNATETGWFQNMLEKANAVCFLRGRVKFIDAEGKPSGAPLQGQAILYFGHRAESFGAEFGEFGVILWQRGA